MLRISQLQLLASQNVGNQKQSPVNTQERLLTRHFNPPWNSAFSFVPLTQSPWKIQTSITPCRNQLLFLLPHCSFWGYKRGEHRLPIHDNGIINTIRMKVDSCLPAATQQRESLALWTLKCFHKRKGPTCLPRQRRAILINTCNQGKNYSWTANVRNAADSPNRFLYFLGVFQHNVESAVR